MHHNIQVARILRKFNLQCLLSDNPRAVSRNSKASLLTIVLFVGDLFFFYRLLNTDNNNNKKKTDAANHEWKAL